MPLETIFLCPHLTQELGYEYIPETVSLCDWSAIETKQCDVKPGDSFLCFRKEEEVLKEILSPSPYEQITLMKLYDPTVEDYQYYRSIRVTVEYGSTWISQGWTRQIVAFLSNSISPYPFMKDCI